MRQWRAGWSHLSRRVSAELGTSDSALTAYKQDGLLIITFDESNYTLSESKDPVNHYSLLRSLEDIFRLHEHLGYATDDPRTGYHLDTIGNDHSVFQGDSSEESGLFPTPKP